MSSPPPAYLTKVGPIEFRNGKSVAMYLALSAEAETLATRTEAPPNDAAALRKLVKEVPAYAPRCALELARVGAQLGIEPHDLPPRVAQERAATAYLASAPKHLRMGLGGPRELGSAGAEYLRAEPWTKLATRARYAMQATLEDHAKGKTYELRLRAHVREGDAPDGPALELEDDGDLARILAYAPDEASPLRLRVTLADEPAYVAGPMEEAFGAPIFPRVAYMLGGRLMPPDDSHALLLAAALRAVGSHARGDEGRGHASSGPFEAHVTADFANALAADPAPSRDTPAGRRAWGRIVAHAVAANLPLPYYDGFVCVVVDPSDARGESVWSEIDGVGATKQVPKGFKRVYDVIVDMHGLLGRWMPALTMSEMFADDLGDQGVGWLVADLAPVSLRVMYVGGGDCDAFHVDFDPRDMERLGRELVDARRVEDVIAQEKKRQATAKAPPPVVEGSWRDGGAYLPAVLPTGWRVGERQTSGMLFVTAGDVSFDIGAGRREGRRWVNVLFRPHPAGRPLSYDEARSVYEKLRGCGRFSEMEAAKDGEALPLLGMRIFSAPIATARPASTVPQRRDEATQAALIERAKPLLAEVVAMARDSGKDMREFCVLLGAERARDGLPDGVIATRELLAKIFASKANDPFDVRGRFEEPRPPHECVVFVKHEDGMEEIHVSLESVQSVPDTDA